MERLFIFCIVMIASEWLIDGFLTAKYHQQRKRVDMLEKHILYLYGKIEGFPAPDYLPELMDCNNCTDKGYCPNCPNAEQTKKQILYKCKDCQCYGMCKQNPNLKDKRYIPKKLKSINDVEWCGKERVDT